ncbi:hypothetical protein X975_21498, partial [Stegodyphus mimosarum]
MLLIVIFMMRFYHIQHCELGETGFSPQGSSLLNGENSFQALRFSGAVEKLMFPG